jgi:hypothetical protein
LLLNGANWDDQLWWVMLSTGIAAALVSLGTGYIGRRLTSWVTDRQRFLLHMLSYLLLTISIVAFILRGLTSPR